MKMKILELFSGTKSISNEFKKRGHEVVTVDLISKPRPTIQRDILSVTPLMVEMQFDDTQGPDIIWASPPCTSFSVASVSHHWRKEGKKYIPQTPATIRGLEIVKKTLSLIEKLNPKYWFMENPCAMLRKMKFMLAYPRITVTYCQYGDTRQKKTDIWGNKVHELYWKPICKPKAPCHERAPRGSRKGTQGLKNAKERGKIPSELGASLCRQLEKSLI